MSPVLTNHSLTFGSSKFVWTGHGWALEKPTEKRSTMSTQITSMDQFTALDDGDKVLVRQDGTDDVVIWVVDGAHLTQGEASLRVSSFEGAVGAGNVFLPGVHHVGETFVGDDPRYFYKIMARQGEMWVMAKTDNYGSARNTSCHVGMPLGMRAHNYDGNDVLVPAWDQAYALYQAELTQARLDKILETGQIPVESDYVVTVLIRGNVGIAPSKDQAKRMVGDRAVEILNVNSTDVSYSKTTTLHKTARWGCACDQVVDADIEGPGDVTSWEVSGCTPAQEGVESAHAAA